jgi:hypothetical protein
MEKAVDGRAELLDPAARAVELVLGLLPPSAAKGTRATPDRFCFTAAAPIDPRAYALSQFGLEMPEPEIVVLGDGDQ